MIDFSIPVEHGKGHEHMHFILDDPKILSFNHRKDAFKGKGSLVQIE
jgi:hypothetical protein